MKVLIFGSTGMVGQGVLRECLLDADVELVQTVGRTPTQVRHPKLRELVHSDLFHYASVEAELTGFDACFLCLGVSSTGMPPEEYDRITYELTLEAAGTLCRLNPEMTFTYVSGSGTDSTEQGRVRWARIKGKTENALLRLPFKAAYMFRPGAIVAMHGERSKTKMYRVLYTFTKPLLSVLRRVLPRTILTTEQMGRAMLAVAKHGSSKKILESADIEAVATR
jgi:uncharacterized protein YbjT (DUF2867 family)